MLTGQFQSIKIAGLSVAVPTDKVPVEHFYDVFGEENVVKFKEMTGVHSVSRAKPKQTASDLGYEAAEDVLNKSELSKKDIGILIFVSQKPDYRVPSTAFVLHKRLGLSENCRHRSQSHSKFPHDPFAGVLRRVPCLDDSALY